MQKRYCRCGAQILVDYIHGTGDNWKPRFYTPMREERTINICPRCAKKLNIHFVR